MTFKATIERRVRAMSHVLDHVVDTYGKDRDRRAVQYDQCVYQTKDGRRCALGMWILADRIHVADVALGSVGSLVSAAHRAGLTLDEILHPSVRGLPIPFWRKIQNLHDESANWSDEGGLTRRGEDAAVRISDFVLAYEELAQHMLDTEAEAAAGAALPEEGEMAYPVFAPAEDGVDGDVH